MTLWFLRLIFFLLPTEQECDGIWHSMYITGCIVLYLLFLNFTHDQTGPRTQLDNAKRIRTRIQLEHIK